MTADPSANPWVMAARPATLWAAIAPVIVGTSLAIADDVFRLDGFLVTLVAAVAIQVGVNYANDVADAAKGADTGERIGPTRAVAAGLISPRAMWGGVAAAFGVAALCGVYLTVIAGPVILAIGAASLIAALGYTNGPVPYGYRGLGELFVFVFFGLVATVGTRFVFDRTAPADAWVAGVVMGLLATAILVANNVRDIDTDRVAGKRTLAVMLGRSGARILYVVTVAGAFVVTAIGVLAGTFPTLVWLVALAIPAAIPAIRAITMAEDGPTLIGALKGTARLQLLMAVLLAAGVLIAA